MPASASADRCSTRSDALTGPLAQFTARRMVAEAMREIENAEGRDARDVEVAESLGMTIDDYHQVLQDASGARIFSYEELSEVGEVVPQEGSLARRRNMLEEGPRAASKRAISARPGDAIASLPERERLVIALYYDEELNLREKSARCSASVNRVFARSTARRHCACARDCLTGCSTTTICNGKYPKLPPTVFSSCRYAG